MAILEKEILITLNTRHISYFENLGYGIPKYKDKYGTFHVKKGTQLTIKVEDLPKGSNIEVIKICDDCGKYVPNQPYYAIIKYRKTGDGKDRCQDCGSIQAGINRKNNLPYNKSLEYYAKENNKEYLLNEFSNKNDKLSSQISKASADEYLWNCPKCGNEYPMRVYQRSNRDYGCPYCCIPVRKVLIGFNDLWTTHPEIAKLLADKERGYKITSGTHSKEQFKCVECGNIDKKSVANVLHQGYSCSKCSDGISYPEKFMMSILNQLNVYFETQKIFKWTDNKRYDFYIPSKQLIIETHGEQHYKYTGFNRTLDEEKENDNYKIILAKLNSIEKYIILNCRESNLDFVKNSIINSNLSEIFNLENINWQESHEFAINSLVIIVCDLFNSGITNTLEIGKIVKLNRTTVVKYLKQGNELSWCKYTSGRSKRKNNII